jgi:hypothetical protein
VKCGHCGSVLGGESRAGDPIIRNRGLILKAGRIVLVCPKCKHDVEPPREIKDQLILFLKR